MYDNKLFELDYFKNLEQTYQELKIDAVLDSLTGVVSRKFILDYACFLIRRNVPFSMQIIDLDNFKRINDNYGHQIGDETLIMFSERLVEAVGEKGLVGRYGGDEFVVILPGIVSYDDCHNYIRNNYFGCFKPMRDFYRIHDLSIYITATSGSASFPSDATTYEELFQNADKALYRGKTKGRNCYIIYVDSKHRNINTARNNKGSLHNVFIELLDVFNSNSENKFKRVNQILIDELKTKGLAYLPLENEYSEYMDKLIGDGRYYTTNNIDTMNKNTLFYKYLASNGIQSVLIYKSETGKGKHGYFLFLEDKIHRIWQDEDISLLVFIVGLYND